MADLVLSRVEKSFDRAVIIEPLDLEVAHGELVVVLGPSGCGKSTLLRLIAGLEPVSGGEIRIGGRVVTSLPPAERRVAMVFQSYALFPHLTVEENIGFGLKVAGVPRAERQEKIARAASVLQLEPLLGRRPKTLSGGQRQRVAIGRAIVKDPAVFLFDEPLSNLDADLRGQMRLEIARLHRDLGATMIYVTHDQVEAMTLAERIVVLREGRIEQIGRPIDVYTHPRNLFVARFIGSPRMNVVEGRVTAVTATGVLIAAPALGAVTLEVTTSSPPAAGTAVSVGFRPEHVVVGGDGPIAARAYVVEHLGSASFVHATCPGGATIVMEQRGGSTAAVGESLRLFVPPDRLMLFDRTGVRL